MIELNIDYKDKPLKKFNIDTDFQDALRAFHIYGDLLIVERDADIGLKILDEFLKNFVENNTKKTNTFTLKNLNFEVNEDGYNEILYDSALDIRTRYDYEYLEKETVKNIDVVISPKERDKFFEDLTNPKTYGPFISKRYYEYFKIKDLQENLEHITQAMNNSTNEFHKQHLKNDIEKYKDVNLDNHEGKLVEKRIQKVIDKYSDDLEIIKNKKIKSRGLDMFELKDLEMLISFERSDNGEYRKDEDIVKIFNGYLSSFENNEDRKTYKDRIINLNELMSDDYYSNLKSQIFDRLIAGDKDFSNLSEYENLLGVLRDDEYLYKESEGFRYTFSDFCCDERIFYGDSLKEIIDNDLKEKGFDSEGIFVAADYLRASSLDKNADYVHLDAYDYPKMLSVEQASDLYRDSINMMNLDDLLVLSEVQKDEITNLEEEKQVSARKLRM